jgi:hypothetical protein
MATPANPIGQAFFATSPDFNTIPLLSTGIEVVSRPGLAASGLGIIYRGTLLHLDPLTGALTKPVVALDCNCVLSNDIDATLAAAPGIVYVHAKVKADALVYPPAVPQGSCNDALRDYGIYVETVLQANGEDTGPTPFAQMATDALIDFAQPKLDPNNPAYDAGYDPRLDPNHPAYDPRRDRTHSRFDPNLTPLEPLAAVRARYDAKHPKTAHDPAKPHGNEPLGHEHGKHAEHHSEKDKK